MKYVTLYDTSSWTYFPPTKVLVCLASRGDSMYYTCVLADKELPTGDFVHSNPLIDIDVKYVTAYVWKTSKHFTGHATPEQRLRLLLGEEINVDGWVVKPV